MTLPTVPTSFAPRPTTPVSPRHARADFSGVFNYFSYFILGGVFFLSIGVFFYGRILLADQASKDATLAKAESALDPATVESFVRLSDRLTAGQTLLGSHIAFSGFFTSLGKILPSDVQFTSLHISFDPSGVARVDGAGIAKSFNTLAAASTAFATDGRIKDVIFSGIRVNKDNSVSFSLSASLDPKIVTYSL